MVPHAIAHESCGDAPVGQGERADRTKLFHAHRVLRDDVGDRGTWRHATPARRGICRASATNCAAKGRVAGIDEAGRGPLAGPVVAAVAVIDRTAAKRKLLKLIDDSKKLALEDREDAYEAMVASGLVQFAVAEASVEEIDRINILQATFLAMRRALQALARPARRRADRRQPGAAAARLPRRDHRRRRCALLFDRRRLDLRQGDARSLHGAARRELPGLRLGDQSRLRQRAASGGPRATRADAPSPYELRRSPAKLRQE